MPSAWSNKRERQYEHIKDSAKKRGRSTRRAKEMAARTVNKQRSQAGETKSGSSSGKRDERSKQELYEEAKKQDISGRSKMSKGELAKAVKRGG